MASETFEEHLDHLRQVFERVRYAKLKLKAQKCTIAAESTPFLGHVLTRDGIRMDADKLTPIQGFPLPRNARELLRFLGMCSYYRKFVKNFATIAAPLYRLVHKDARFKFGDEELQAFESLKRALCGDLVLRFPDFDKAMNEPAKRFVIITDASKVGLGAVLCQPDDKKFLRPVYFASRSCNSAESRYSPTELEALGLKFAAGKFAQFIIGMPVRVLTDHKALIPMFKKQTETGNLRMDRFLLELKSKYDFDVIYYTGKSNVVADALSRGLSLDEVKENEDGTASVRRIAAALLARTDTSVSDDHELWIGELETGDMASVYKFLRDKELPTDSTERQRTRDMGLIS